MAQIYCKSDCMFSNNETRTCILDLVEYSQLSPDSPTLHCQQYVKVTVGEKKFTGIDIERSRMAGSYAKPIAKGGMQ